ncbi:MAG: peptidoglycan-binding protein [Acidobacteriota bacterium]
MADTTEEQSIFMDLAEDDGVIATHFDQISFPKHVAPSTPDTDDTHNTIKDFLLAIACVNVPKDHFEFDSSFVAPAAKESFVKLSTLFDALTRKSVFDPTPPLAIFGHADPVGNPDYNSILSARRARAIYAVLIRDTKAWDELATKGHPMGGDVWGTAAIETMIDTVGFPDGTPASISQLPPKQAAASIKANAKLREALYLKYMNALCVRSVKGVESPFILEKDKHFLARGADKNGKGDLQGCGEFNPKLILSKKKDLEAKKSKVAKEKRDRENALNRRVLIFLFKPGSKVNPKKWPCPHVKQGAAAVKVCEKRFWPDFKDRVAQDPEADRTFREERKKPRQDTFGGTWACRFYQGIAQFSPCEGVSRKWALRVLIDTPRLGEELKPLAETRFVAVVKEKPESPESPEVLRIHGATGKDGTLRLPVFDEHTFIALKLEAGKVLQPGGEPKEPPNPTVPPTEEEEKGFLPITLDAGSLRHLDTGSLPDANDGSEDNKKLAVKQRLFNLGYGREKIETWTEDEFKLAVKQFQKNEQLKNQDGTVDDDTRSRLAEEHEPARPKPEETED